MSNASSISQPTAPVSGSSVTPVYTKRNMRMFVINEGEYQTISAMNSQATASFSVSSFFASAGLGIYTNAVFAEKLTSAGEVAQVVAAPALLVMSIALLVLGILSLRSRRRIWDDIRTESAEDK